MSALTATVDLWPTARSVPAARHVVGELLACWGAPHDRHDAEILVTELVANVVRHAHTTMEFTLGLRGGLLCLTVRDGSRKLPRPKDPAVSEAGGRGLHLVRELTDAWGVLPVSDGKVVWTKLTTGAA